MPYPEIPVKLDAVELDLLPLMSPYQLMVGHQGALELVSGEHWAIEQLPSSQRFNLGGETVPEAFAIQPFTMKPVYLYSVRDAYYLPVSGVVLSGEGHAFRDAMGEAKYFSPDLSSLPFMEKRGDETVFSPPENIDRLDRIMVTMPMGATGNYGHFLLDCLPGIAATRIAEFPANFRYAFPALKPWHLEHLARQGIDPVILDGPVYYCNQIVFTSCMDHNLHWPNKHFRMIAPAAKHQEPHRKVYLSRANQKRRFISEGALEASLSDDGFEIVAPEGISVSQQIEMFEQSKIIVGATGAAFANIIFCAPGTMVVEIQPRGMHNIWVRNLCILMGLRWMPYYCESTIMNEAHPEAGMEFDVNVDDFLAFVGSVG